MLYAFLNRNQNELNARCRAKAMARLEFQISPLSDDHGAPKLLRQIAEILRGEQGSVCHERAAVEVTATMQAKKATKAKETIATAALAAPLKPAVSTFNAVEISRAAALHGAELLRKGYRVDQVVHEYGDLCQAVTELAIELNEPISVDEFRIFNRCLDDAIAASVAGFDAARQHTNGRSQNLPTDFSGFALEHRRLNDIAIQAFYAIRSGNVGLNGATANLLFQTLGEMQSLADQRVPQTQLTSETASMGPS